VSQLSKSEKCTNFLINNGWKFAFNDNDENEDENCDHYDKINCFSISIDHITKKITFFDDSGDIYTCDINIYTLIGFLIHHRQVTCTYNSFKYSKQIIDRVKRGIPADE
jgi:hypothetical protein